MSVVTCKEIHDGRDGGDSVSSNSLNAEITRAFRVTTDNVYDDAAVALASCPNLGEAHPTIGGLYVMDRRARNTEGKKVWNVTITYSIDSAGAGGGSRTNPLSWRPKISWGTERSIEPAHYDKDGNAILNSVGDHYDDGVPVETSFWTANVQKNVSAVPLWLSSYRHSINADSFVLDGIIFAPFAARLSGVRVGEWARQSDVWYRVLEMEFKFRDTWVKSIMDRGRRRKVYDELLDAWHIEDCVNERGTITKMPVLLDGNGGQLSDPSPSTAVYREHHVYLEKPFSVLPIY